MDIAFLGWIGSWGILAPVVLITVLLIGSKEIGYRIGMRRREDGAVEGAGVIVGSILALTAFVLALTLSAATTRLTERRATALAEANAIGTAWLQAGVLAEEGSALPDLIRDYAEARLAFLSAERGSEEIGAAIAASDALQAVIWAEVAAIVTARGDSAATSLMNATNGMFDAGTAARYAVENGLPVVMVRLLAVMAIGAMVSLGLQLGLMGRPNYRLAAVLALFWAVVMVHVLDMGTARIGRFGIEQDPYLWTLDTMRPAPEA